MNIVERIIAAIRNKPTVEKHRCPYCFSDRLTVLGSNAARFKGEIQMVFTCSDCERDSMYHLWRDGSSSKRPVPCPKQARVVNHSLAEIWEKS